ncbi:hypothetical protein MFLAVUS_007435 [Mucor flavus]|uniref:Transposase n=1 Tax=Mucor flavus TaxID=439312 RepID=A0ABP9Z4A9_9FUNG
MKAELNLFKTLTVKQRMYSRTAELSVSRPCHLMTPSNVTVKRKRLTDYELGTDIGRLPKGTTSTKRPQKLYETSVRALVRNFRANPFEPYRSHTEALRNADVNVSRDTVIKKLKEEGLLVLSLPQRKQLLQKNISNEDLPGQRIKLTGPMNNGDLSFGPMRVDSLSWVMTVVSEYSEKLTKYMETVILYQLLNLTKTFMSTVCQAVSFHLSRNCLRGSTGTLHSKKTEPRAIRDNMHVDTSNDAKFLDLNPIEKIWAMLENKLRCRRGSATNALVSSMGTKYQVVIEAKVTDEQDFLTEQKKV